MKIAMFLDAWDILGWWRIHVENICKQLIENHDCTIDLFVRALKTDEWIIKKDNERLLDWKLHIIRCWRPKSFFNPFERLFSLFSMLFVFLRYNKKEKYDILHAHTYLPLLVGKIGSMITKTPLIVTVHGSQIMDMEKKSLAYYVQKILLTKIKYGLEICVGKNFLEYPNVNKVVNIWNWVNMKDFQWGHYVVHHIKKLLFVWRLEWTKGIDVLIDAMDYIINVMHVKNIFLDVIGYWYDEKQYKDQTHNKKLDQHIIFHGKKVWKKIVEFYKHTDLMIVPSRAEWFGIIILEAMASGIPVIATKSGGPEDIIQDWVNWCLVPKDDYIALAKKMLEFIEGKIDNIQELVDNWYMTIQEKYTWEIIGDQIYKQYTSLL